MQGGEIVCPCSDDPRLNAVVRCLDEQGLQLDSFNGLSCACFGPYQDCVNASSTNRDGGYPSSYDGCGI
jgi:hypothetical protein